MEHKLFPLIKQERTILKHSMLNQTGISMSKILITFVVEIIDENQSIKYLTYCIFRSSSSETNFPAATGIDRFRTPFETTASFGWKYLKKFVRNTASEISICLNLQYRLLFDQFTVVDRYSIFFQKDVYIWRFNIWEILTFAMQNKNTSSPIDK